MNIQEIIKKLLAGEALTEEEKSFAEGFDLQAITDKASAGARRKAEADTKNAQAKVEELTKQLEELTAKGGKDESALVKMQKQLEALTKAKAESDAKVAAQERKTAIAAAAKANGVNIADGVSQSAFETLLNLAVGETDLTDETALKVAMEQFKKDNPAMIADGGHSGIGGKGKPLGGGSSFIGNPWHKDSQNLTEQMRILKENPQEAVRMAAAEGIELKLD